MKRGSEDEIIIEVRKARAKLMKKCGGTLDGLFDYIKKLEKTSGRKYVSPKPKRLRPSLAQ